MNDNFNHENGFESAENEQNRDVYSSQPENTSAVEPKSNYVTASDDGSQPNESDFQSAKHVFGQAPSDSISPDNESLHTASKPATPYVPYGYNGNQNPYSVNNSANGYNGQQYGQQNQRPAQSPQYRPYGYAQTTPPTEPPKKSGGKKVVGLVIAAVVVVAIVAVFSALFSGNSKNPSTNSTTSPNVSSNVQAGESTSSPVEYQTSNSTEVKELSAVEVAEKARKSVVGVMVYSSGKLSGEGSGVAMAVDKTGKYTYILTCAHVISDSGVTYRIQTLDSKTYEASLVAYDTRTDIGVLKVEATDIPVAELGDSTTLKVGETVYAIGNPGGSEYFGSMTDGIISAIDRSVSSTYTMTCIQHNAAINPGNSGGALVNSAGQVIGINSSKIAATDYEGMGFAVPIATAKSVAESLIEYGYVPNRPKLGIEYASVSSYQLYSMVVAIKGLPSGSLVIAGISTDSSLVNTDAQVGDLIIAVNGKKMDDSSVLLDLINTGAVGDSITLTLCRIQSKTYKTTQFDVTLTLVEDKGNTESTTEPVTDGGYYRGGSSSFEDFFKQYFGY